MGKYIQKVYGSQCKNNIKSKPVSWDLFMIQDLKFLFSEILFFQSHDISFLQSQTQFNQMDKGVRVKEQDNGKSCGNQQRNQAAKIGLLDAAFL